MPGTLLNIRIPEELHRSLDTFSKAAGYGNVQEFAREALREHLKRRRIEWGVDEMRKLRGSERGKKLTPMTPEERDKLAMEGPPRQIMDLFGTVKVDSKKLKAFRRRERKLEHARDERLGRAATSK